MGCVSALGINHLFHPIGLGEGLGRGRERYFSEGFKSAPLHLWEIR